jgi:beta-xylosidase
MATGNPIIHHKFTADPTALVHSGTIYLYTGHDEAPPGREEYIMHEWLCFSSKNMTDWQEHSSPLRATDFKWAKGDAYASKVIFHNNRFYWFVSVSHATIPGKALGVAISESPTGPFIDAIGSALINQQMIPDAGLELVNLDPTVLIDDDNEAHLIWGNSKCYYTKLSADLLTIKEPIRTLSLPSFTEGSNLHAHNRWYYLSYGSGFHEKVAYAMSRDPEGPWEYKGILNEIPGNCQTNRPAIVDFKGKSYFFYHNGALPNGGSHRRSVCLDYLHYNADDTIKRIIMTSEGLESPQI